VVVVVVVVVVVLVPAAALKPAMYNHLGQNDRTMQYQL
jgi:hypothetical protein